MRNLQFVPENIYHIYNRGVEKRDIFLKDNDKWRFLQGLALFNDEKTSSNILWQLEKKRGGVTLKVLKEFFINSISERNNLIRILAYCLMPNHFHLLIEEVKQTGISRFMHKLGVGYTGYFNKKYERDGALFQGTFKATVISKEDYLKYLLIYINVVNPGQLIEPNLKKEGVKNVKEVMKFAEQYIWSTNLEYLGRRNSIIIEKGIFSKMFNPKEYVSFAEAALIGKRFDLIENFIFE